MRAGLSLHGGASRGVYWTLPFRGSLPPPSPPPAIYAPEYVTRGDDFDMPPPSRPIADRSMEKSCAVANNIVWPGKKNLILIL